MRLLLLTWWDGQNPKSETTAYGKVGFYKSSTIWDEKAMTNYITSFDGHVTAFDDKVDTAAFRVQYIRSTEKAWLIAQPGKAAVWVPKSKCALTNDDQGLTEFKWVTMPEWLALDKNMEDPD